MVNSRILAKPISICKQLVCTKFATEEIQWFVALHCNIPAAKPRTEITMRWRRQV